MKPDTPYAIACKNALPDLPEQQCSCDFRINIYYCPESSILVLSNWVLFSYCGLLSIAAAISLWHLIKKKEQTFFLPSRRDRGIIRPRPQHIYFTMSLTYCPFQMIHSILLLTNSYPNIFWAELGHSLPTASTAIVAILYPLSIVYSTSAFEVGTNFASTRPISMSSVISEVPITRQAIKADLTCIATIIITFGLFLTVAALNGHYADMSNYLNANKLFLIQHLIWAAWSFLYFMIMIWTWYRFMNIVLENINELTNQHQTQNSELQNKLEQLRKGTRNLSLPVYGQTLAVIIYIPTLILYGLYHRSNTIFNHKINLIYMGIWYFAFPLILNITQGLMIYNIITTPLNNPGRNSSDRNNGGNEKTDDGKKTINSVGLNDKRTNNEMSMEIARSDDINEEETFNTISTNFGKRSTSIRYSDQYINNGEKLNDETSIKHNSLNNSNNITKKSILINETKGRNSYSNQTIFSDTSTLISNGNIRPTSPAMTNFTSGTVSPISNPSSPTSPSYLVHPIINSISQNNVNSQRGHNQRESISSNASNGSNTSTTSSSDQRREWLTRKPSRVLSHPKYRDKL